MVNVLSIVHNPLSLLLGAHKGKHLDVVTPLRGHHSTVLILMCTPVLCIDIQTDITTTLLLLCNLV